MSLAGLSAERLLELGGLKRQCSERLRCVAHGLSLPCDLCDLEDDAARGVVCETCGYHFEQALLVTEGRGCQSVAEFARSGRVAFESEARFALQRVEAEARRREQAEREAAEQARLARLRAEQERQRREAAERAEREARERLSREREAAEERERRERERVDAETAVSSLARRRLSRALWASALCAVIGASMIWSMPFISPPKSLGNFLEFASAACLVWAFAVSPLFGNERPPVMRAGAPLAWGFMTFVWPGLMGLVLCLLVAKAELTLKFAGAVLFGGTFLLAVAVFTCTHAGAALSMRAPWATGVSPDFRGLRSPWVWAGLALTAILNLGLVRGTTTGFTGWFGNDSAQSSPSSIAEAVSSTTRPEAVPPAQGRGPALPPVPSSAGYVTDVVGFLPAEDVAYLGARLEILAKEGDVARLLVVPSTGEEDIATLARRVGNTWNDASSVSRTDLLVLVATVDRRVRIEVIRPFNERLTDGDAAQLTDLAFRPVASRAGVVAGLRSLVDQFERTVAAKEAARAAEGDLRAKALAAVAMTVAAVNTWDGKQPTLAPAAQAKLDAARARLEVMPRLARGDRKVARQLHASGMALLGQDGFAALAVEKMQLAHAADPLDVQILNDLAYAELSAGAHRAAVDHLLMTLRLAPDRTSAWVNLAETTPFTASSREEAVRSASDLYLTGYWFSTDRAKALDYLRGRTIAADAKDEIRVAAANTLRRIEMMQGSATTNPAALGTTSDGERFGAPLNGSQATDAANHGSIDGKGATTSTAPVNTGNDGSAPVHAAIEALPRHLLGAKPIDTRDATIEKASEPAKRVFELVLERLSSNKGRLKSADQLLRDPLLVDAIRARDSAIGAVPANRTASARSLRRARELLLQQGSTQQIFELLGEAFASDPFNVSTLDDVTAMLWRIERQREAVEVAAWTYVVDPFRPAALIVWMEKAAITGEISTDKAGVMMVCAYALSGADPLVLRRLREIGDAGAGKVKAAEAARLAVAMIETGLLR